MMTPVIEVAMMEIGIGDPMAINKVIGITMTEPMGINHLVNYFKVVDAISFFGSLFSLKWEYQLIAAIKAGNPNTATFLGR